MIQATDLRLGNLVMFNNKVIEVEKIEERFISFRYPKCELSRLLEEDFNPIPITAEFFEVRGFQIHPHLKDVQLGEGYILRQDNLLYFVQGWGAVIDVNSVHELQNLYYALTKTELEL